MLVRFLLTLAFLALLPGCPSSVETEPQPSPPQQHEEDGFLQPSTFHLPKDGTRNENSTIGPYCCTGFTATIQTTEGYPAGYVYFFNVAGQPFNEGKSSFAPDVKILLAGLADAHDPDSDLLMGEVDWDVEEMKLIKAKSMQVGQLEFTVTIEQVTFVSSSGGDFFDMVSFAVRVDVAVVG